jgi:hypothetical protein
MTFANKSRHTLPPAEQYQYDLDYEKTTAVGEAAVQYAKNFNMKDDMPQNFEPGVKIPSPSSDYEEFDKAMSNAEAAVEDAGQDIGQDTEEHTWRRCSMCQHASINHPLVDLREPPLKRSLLTKIWMFAFELCFTIALILFCVTGLVVSVKYCGHWIGLW